MIEPKNVEPGLWYVEAFSEGGRSYTVVEVHEGGDVYLIGSGRDHVIQEPQFKFIAPVPPPPSGKGAARPTIITSDAEGQAIREEAKRRALAYATETGHPDDLPPIEGEDGSLRWESVQEIKGSQVVTRRKRITD